MCWLTNFVMTKEGFRSEAYLDAVGVPTIGYGSTKGVKLGDKISKENAGKLLADELQDFKHYVERYSNRVGYYWNDNQVDALTSFIFNLGKGALNQVTQDGTRDNNVIAEKMKLYYNAGGRKLQGLVIRRLEESEHFSS